MVTSTKGHAQYPFVEKDRIAMLRQTSERYDPRNVNTDSDGFNDYEELITTKTKRNIADNDRDGLNDNAEIIQNTRTGRSDTGW